MDDGQYAILTKYVCYLIFLLVALALALALEAHVNCKASALPKLGQDGRLD